MDSEIQEKFKLYIELNQEISQFRKKQNEQKKVLQSLEESIKEYMTANDLDSISLKGGEIILYERKVSQTLKKTTIVDKLTEKLKGDSKKAEELTESIFSNKVFTVEPKIRTKIKKL
jgi:regulator of sigma D